MKEQVQRINEKISKVGKPYSNVLAGDKWHILWEELTFQEGDVIEFDEKDNGTFNPVMENIKKVETPDKIQGIKNRELDKSKSIALLACLKAVGSASESLKIRSIEELESLAEHCYQWFMKQIENNG